MCNRENTGDLVFKDENGLLITTNIIKVEKFRTINAF